MAGRRRAGPRGQRRDAAGPGRTEAETARAGSAPAAGAAEAGRCQAERAQAEQAQVERAEGRETAEVQPPAPPRLRRADLHRLSEGANGLNLWGYITDDPLCRVLAPGYFAPAAGWLAPFDRILVTAGAGGGRPSHATLVVAGPGPAGPRVRRLPG